MVPNSPVVVPSLLTNPNDWLEVTDLAGNVIAGQVAFVLVAPGIAIDGQNRSAAAPNAAEFLDAVFAGTSQFAANHDADLSFVKAPDLSALPDSEAFNDLVDFTTAGELLEPLIRLALARISSGLRVYHGANGSFPDAADSPDGECDAGTTNGFLPTSPGSCGTAISLEAWLDPDWVPEIGYERVGADSARLTVLATAQVSEVTP